MKKLTIFMAVLVFSLVFATQTYAAGMLGMGTSSTTSTDNTGSGSILGGNRGVGAGSTGTTGVSGTGMSVLGTTPYGSSAYSTATPPSTYGSYGSYNGSTSQTLSTPTRFNGISPTSYNTNGTMRGFNYTAKATRNANNNNWGWMGLLGLLGLIGLRSNNNNREREQSNGKH